MSIISYVVNVNIFNRWTCNITPQSNLNIKTLIGLYDSVKYNLLCCDSNVFLGVYDNNIQSDILPFTEWFTKLAHNYFILK